MGYIESSVRAYCDQCGGEEEVSRYDDIPKGWVKAGLDGAHSFNAETRLFCSYGCLSEWAKDKAEKHDD